MYNYYGCGFIQQVTPAVDFTAVPWRTDLLLPAPRIVSPRPDSVFCLDSAYGSGSNIFLEWSTVAGATHYIVQWAGNPQVSGPDVREAIVSAPTTVYELVHGDDIRLGEDIYWRVFAINRTTGGASSKSQPRKLSFECNSNESGKGLNPCTDYDVQMSVNGTEYLSCCDENVFWLEISFACKDQFDRELITVDSVEWSVRSNPNDPDAAVIKDVLAGGLKSIVSTHAENSQVIEVCVEVTFTDNVLGGTFTCDTCKKVFVDCDTPFTDRPWSPFFGTDTYNRLIAIHYDYLSYEPMGLMVNPSCGCDWTCSTVEGQVDSFSLGDLNVVLEVIETEICEEQPPVGVFFFDFDAIDPVTVEIYYTNLDGTETLVDTLNLLGGVTNYELQLYTPDARVGRACTEFSSIRVVRTDSLEEHITTVTQTGMPFENCLYSDRYIAVATGPVFKIPIEVCDGIETECCDCTPERLSFTLGPTGEESLGELIHGNLVDGVWGSTGGMDAFGCENFLGPSEMYCQGDTWVFRTLVGCDDCNTVNVDGCSICLEDSFPVSVTAFSDATQILAKTKIAHRRPVSEIWDISGEIKITPACGGVIHVVDLNLFASTSPTFPIGLGYAPGPDHTGWGLSLSSSETLLSCDPLAATANLVFVKAGCDDIEIIFELANVPTCSPCAELFYLQYDFYSCEDPWNVSFDMYDPALPELVHVHIYDWVGMECGDDFKRKTDVVALEARVNIPLDPCFFLVRDGMLTLNLESLLGPGLGIGYRENGCPYIYSYGGTGEIIHYHETLIYCCYSYGYGPEPGGDPDPLLMNEPSYPSMSEGIAITPFFVLASGGTEPYTFSVFSGSLPAGLSLNSSTGEVSGTPTTAGSGSTVFQVTDDVATSTTSTSRPWTVASNVSIADPTYPSMTEGVAITPFNVVASNGVTPYTYSVFAGSLPAGLSLNSSTGQVSGTPTTASSGTTTFRVEDDTFDTAETSAIGWTVSAAALSINEPNYPSMSESNPITPFYVIGSGGTAPYTYSVASGSLPAGISLNSSTGEVSGTPTTFGSGSTVFRVTDDVAATADSSSRPWNVTF